MQEITGLKGKVAMKKSQQDDPHKRKPDITRAKTYLGWEPKVFKIITMTINNINIGVIEGWDTKDYGVFQEGTWSD